MRKRTDFDDPWELRSVPTFLQAVALRVDLKAGLDLLVVVDNSEERQIVGLAELMTSIDGCGNSSDYADILRPGLERLCPGFETGVPRCTAHILRCREGRVVHARDDVQLAYGLLYAKNLISVFVGDIVILTPHGWRVRQRAGADPTLTSLQGRALRRLDAV